MLRVAIIPVVLGLFYVPWEYARQIATVLYAAAAITDWVDGYLTRRWNQTTRFGAFLDPVADELLVAICLVMLLRDAPGILLCVMVAIVMGRQIHISVPGGGMGGQGAPTTVRVRGFGA